MAKYRIPSMVLLVLAGSGGIVATGSGAVPAAAVSDRDLAHEAHLVGKEALIRKLIVGAVGFLTLALVVFLARQIPLFIGDPSWWSGGQQSESASGTPSSPIGMSDGLQSASPEGGGDTWSTPEPTPSAKPTPKPTDPPLPPGVREVTWRDVLADSVPEGTEVRLRLGVVFDKDTNPDDYEVVVTTTNGAMVTGASASCTTSGARTTCRPTEEMMKLREYNLQFHVRLGAVAQMPQAIVRLR